MRLNIRGQPQLLDYAKSDENEPGAVIHPVDEYSEPRIVPPLDNIRNNELDGEENQGDPPSDGRMEYSP